jgi:copper resistance protein C
MKTVTSLVVAVVLVLAAATAVSAHAELVQAQPADGGAVPTGPVDVIGSFSEALRPNSHMELHAGPRNGEVVSNAAVDGRTLRIGLEGLLPGGYTVTWTAVGQDGHVERGDWTFTVAEPSPSPTPSPSPSETPSGEPSASASPSPSPSPSASPTPAPSAAPGTTGTGSDAVLPIIAALVIIGGGLAALLLRGRRSA